MLSAACLPRDQSSNRTSVTAALHVTRERPRTFKRHSAQIVTSDHTSSSSSASSASRRNLIAHFHQHFDIKHHVKHVGRLFTTPQQLSKPFTILFLTLSTFFSSSTKLSTFMHHHLIHTLFPALSIHMNISSFYSVQIFTAQKQPLPQPATIQKPIFMYECWSLVPSYYSVIYIITKRTAASNID